MDAQNNFRPGGTISKILSDPSAWALLFSNIAVIFLAVLENWSLLTIMLVYWCQSVIIGIFNFIRILRLKDFSVENFKINGMPASNGTGTKIFTAFFFAIHYGFFHFGYLIFLLVGAASTSAINAGEIIFILISAGIFFANHLFSFIYNLKADEQKRKNIGNLMFYPYARIVPMHLTIVFGGFLGGGAMWILIFLGLKTIADLAMHSAEHNI